MSLTFNCEHCGKKIEAPDSSAGKLGKCPRCHNKVCVPQPQSDEDEELRLAPVDETDTTKQKQLLAETCRLTQNILESKGEPAAADDRAAVPTAAAGDEQLTTNIIMYLRQMADGELDDATSLERSIASGGRKAKKILDQMARMDLPEPELQDVPQQVLSSLMKQLRSKL